jgi:hypothetical protein
VAAGTISTFAGGAGGPGRATSVSNGGFCGLGNEEAYAGGSLYFAAGGMLRQVNAQTDRLTTPLGTAAQGPLGDGGPAALASVNDACAVAVDHFGNLVVGDNDAVRIRVVAAATGTFYGQAMTAGDIYTIAGNGITGFSGDGGPATQAEMDFPGNVAIDSAGNVLVADTRNHRIRVVAVSTGTYYKQKMTAGDIYTIAGNGTLGFSGDGGPATQAELDFPRGVAVDTTGNVLIADTGNNRIRVVADTTGTHYGKKMTAGDIYTIAGNGNGNRNDEPMFSGGNATQIEVAVPDTMTTDSAGNVVIAATGGDQILVVAVRTGTFYGQAMTAGDIYTVAGGGSLRGSGILATMALMFPTAITVDSSGNLVLCDAYGTPTPAIDVEVVAAHTGTYYKQKMTAGDLYRIAGNGWPQFSGDGGPATGAVLQDLFGIAADATGNLLIADSANQRIRVVAAHTGSHYGRTMTAGNIYTVAGDGKQGFSGDGGPATKAEIDFPNSAAGDAAGDLFIADNLNNRIRMVAAQTGTFLGQKMTAGDIYTIAGNGSSMLSGNGGPAAKAGVPNVFSVRVDGAGNLLLGCEGEVRMIAVHTGTYYGRKVTAGDIYAIAGNGTFGFSGDGGPATQAEVDPSSATVDGSGNLLIADAGNQRIRVVADSTGTFYGQAMTAGDIYSIAGNGTFGFSGDGGPATRAEFNDPSSVAADAAGNVLIADTGNSRIRVIAAHTGTYYGKKMTEGHIYTIAGNGGTGFAGDGGPAIDAETTPDDVVASSTGDVLIIDAGSNRIREITG